MTGYSARLCYLHQKDHQCSLLSDLWWKKDGIQNGVAGGELSVEHCTAAVNIATEKSASTVFKLSELDCYVLCVIEQMPLEINLGKKIVRNRGPYKMSTQS